MAPSHVAALAVAEWEDRFPPLPARRWTGRRRGCVSSVNPSVLGICRKKWSGRFGSVSAFMKVMITVGAIFGFFGSLSASTDGEINFVQAFVCSVICAALVPVIARFGVASSASGGGRNGKFARSEP